MRLLPTNRKIQLKISEKKIMRKDGLDNLTLTGFIVIKRRSGKVRPNYLGNLSE